MDYEPDDFDALRKLLALKRHEQPPPGFFRDLPGKVQQRIAVEEQGQAGWWTRLREAFELRPALSMGFAAGLCVLLGLGIQRGRQEQTGGDPAVAIGGPVVETQVESNPFNVSTGELVRPPQGIFDPQIGSKVERVEYRTNATVRP